MTIKPLSDHILIEPIKEDEKTKSGIFLPETAMKEKSEQGNVIATGPGKKTDDGKMLKLQELFKTEKKCMIYCDDIQLGKDISKHLNIPFVHGQTPGEERLKILNESKNVMVSRVGDESISVDGVEVGIEIDWHGRSSRQAIQRAGRLMHNKEAMTTEHHIIMTVDEYKKDKERFQGYYEKGMKVVIHKEFGLSIIDMISYKTESKQSVLNKIAKLLQKQPIHA